MKIKVFVNEGGSLIERGKAFIAIKGADEEREERGWTLGAFYSNIGGLFGDFEWWDMAAGEFYDYVPANPNSEEVEIILENIGGIDYIKRLVAEMKNAHN